MLQGTNLLNRPLVYTRGRGAVKRTARHAARGVRFSNPVYGAAGEQSMTESSRCSASIEIGGPIGFPVMERVAEAAEAAGGRLGWNADRATAEDVHAAALEAAAVGEPLLLVSENALFGAFSDIEDALTAGGVPWLRRTEGDNQGADTSAEIRAFDGTSPIGPRAARRYGLPGLSMDEATREAVAAAADAVPPVPIPRP